MTLVVIGGLWLLLVLVGVPIGIAMIFVSVGYFWYVGRGMFLAVQRMSTGWTAFRCWPFRSSSLPRPS